MASCGLPLLGMLKAFELNQALLNLMLKVFDIWCPVGEWRCDRRVNSVGRCMCEPTGVVC